LEICLRLGWPIGGLLVSGLLFAGGDPTVIAALSQPWAMIVAVPLNSYLQVRWMLKRSLPVKTRTRGPVAVWRAIGTTICVLLLLAFVGGAVVRSSCLPGDVVAALDLTLRQLCAA